MFTRAAALGAADSGAAASTLLGAAALVVDDLLLQPIAFRVIEGLAVRWWTPAGLALLVGVCLVNSGIVCGVIRAILVAMRRKTGTDT